MRINDAITGAVLVVFAIAEITYTRTFPSLHGQAYGPDLFPAIIGFGLVGCGLVLMVRGLLSRQPSKAHTRSPVPAWIDLSHITGSSHASRCLHGCDSHHIHHSDFICQGTAGAVATGRATGACLVIAFPGNHIISNHSCAHHLWCFDH